MRVPHLVLLLFVFAFFLPSCNGVGGTQAPSSTGPGGDNTDGDDPDSPDVGCDLPHHIIFASSILYTPDFGGLAGADGICGGLATAGGLPGTYLAILSTSTANAASRISTTDPVCNTKSELVSTSYSGLFDGTIDQPIAFDEYSNPISRDQLAWTGSDASGTVTANTCSDFSNTTSDSADAGNVTLMGQGWLNNGLAFCATQSLRLYCISSTAQ